MTELTHLSLFSGIGGLDLAAEAAGFQTVGQCEWADYPTKELEKHWPDVPRWRDIRTLTGDDFYAKTGRRSITVASGGFPCQPFSVAGKRRGKEDDRYLWPEMCRVISETRPTWVIGENVPGIVNLALDTVLSDLESQGYTCQTFIIPAAGVDAPHRRERICIVAYSRSGRRDGARNICDIRELQRGTFKQGQANQFEQPGKVFTDVADAYGTERGPQRGQRDGLAQSSDGIQEREKGAGGSEYSRKDVADTDEQRLQGWQRGSLQECASEWAARESDSPLSNTESTECQRQRREARGRWPEFGRGGWWPTEPGLGGVADGLSYRLGGYWPAEPEGIPRIATGIPHRVDQLKCYGNAVVPPQFYPFFKYIAEIERNVL